MSGRTVRVCKKMLMLGALAQIGILKAHEATTVTTTTTAITDSEDFFLEKMIDSQHLSQKYLNKLAEIMQLLNNERTPSQLLFSKQSQQHQTEQSQQHQEHEDHNTNKDKKKNKNDEDKSEKQNSEESDSESDSDSDDEDDRNGGITIPVLEWVKGIFPRIVPQPQTNN